MPKLVPHPALQPGTEVVDPSKEKTKVSPGPGGWNPALRGRILRVSGPRPRAKILESENANGPLRAAEGPPSGPPPFLVENIKLRAGPGEPGGGPGRPPGPPKTLRNLKNHQKNNYSAPMVYSVPSWTTGVNWVSAGAVNAVQD